MWYGVHVCAHTLHRERKKETVLAFTMRLVVAYVLLLVGGCAAVLPVLTHVHSKFEYEHSLKGPYLTNSKGDVPFWTHGGSELGD